jgi:DnaK suppressor protein
MAKKRKITTARKPAKKVSKASVKARKTPTVSRISARQWAPIRKKLLRMRDDLLKTVREKQSMDVGSVDVGDEADQATSSLEKEMLFELNDNERTMLDQIEGALRKMEKNFYGLCESCQKPIPKPRLQAVPFARYCINCQSSSETSAQAG